MNGSPGHNASSFGGPSSDLAVLRELRRAIRKGIRDMQEEIEHDRAEVRRDVASTWKAAAQAREKGDWRTVQVMETELRGLRRRWTILGGSEGFGIELDRRIRWCRRPGEDVA